MVPDVPYLVIVDLLGVLVFGISGALLALRSRFDLMGVVALSVVTGIGGGMLRDVLVGVTPPAALRDWRYLAAGLAAAAIGALVSRVVSRLEPAIVVLDAIGLGVFAFTGTSIAVQTVLPVLACLVLGVLTGVGGGMLRDVLAGRVPIVLRREVYATAALAGAAVTWVGSVRDLDTTATAVVAVAVTAITRLVALRFDFNLPAPPDPHVD